MEIIELGMHPYVSANILRLLFDGSSLETDIAYAIVRRFSTGEQRWNFQQASKSNVRQAYLASALHLQL